MLRNHTNVKKTGEKQTPKKMRRTVGVMLLCMLGVFLFSACSKTTTSMGSTKTDAMTSEQMGDTADEMTSDAYHKITAEEAKNMMDAGGVTIVDVRTQEEYDGGHVPGAIVVPVESIGKTQPEALPDLNQTLLVYCRSGRRSQQASQQLVALGYTSVYDFGGIIDWPYETEQ